MGNIVSWVVGTALAKKATKAQSANVEVDASQAAPAAAEAAPPAAVTTNADTPQAILRKKKAGKAALTIATGSSSGGTGVNV